MRFICRGKIRVKGLEKRKLTYFVEPLAEGEEAITEYYTMEGTDSADELNYGQSGTLSTGMRRLESTTGMRYGRSPSISTNASFSVLESPMNSEGHSLHRVSHAQKKISIDSNASIAHALTIPIIEEPGVTSRPTALSSNGNGNSTRRIQVSPLYNEPEVMPDSSFVGTSSTIINRDTSTRGKKHKRSGKKCTIC